MGSVRRVGKYEVGRTLGEGTFAKVKFAQVVDTGEAVAMKVLDKDKILRHKMVDQIKREISIMKLVRHPNVVRLHEVLASKTKIYIVLEFVSGGELFDKIVHQGKLSEDESRKYFQQLIDAVDYCHSKQVYHRDLKPENLLLDSRGILKISDFGLSALPQQVQKDGLLHTTCGTPNYVAPEVLNDRGYDGRCADIWSCGVILFVLMAGFLPFDEMDLTTLYRKIHKAEFTFPAWFSPSAKRVLSRLLDPSPRTRITAAQLRSGDEWFMKGYKQVVPPDESDASIDDIKAVFSEDGIVTEEKTESKPSKPSIMNAFELISMSEGLNLSGLFRKDIIKRQTRFTSKQTPAVILSTLELASKALRFQSQSRGFKIRMEGLVEGGRTPLTIVVEVFEVTPGLHMVEVRKAAGDILEYHKFYKLLLARVKELVWKSAVDLTSPGSPSPGKSLRANVPVGSSSK